ncbi:MAG TPA: potassium-transporting ATPase subunit KdpA, partial [Burkholderiaceae bacterium]|nr:potassium-transporting ATPase subunit KdpA [Burkholderiaceae bacterium]
MNLHSLTLLILYLAVLVALSYPLGRYLVQSMQGDANGVAGVARKILGPAETAIYRLCGIRAEEEMAWPQYTYAILLFSVLGVLAVYALQRLQAALPLNPQAFGSVSADSSFNTAVSFVTNTNWQGYSGESTMSYLTQMLGLAVQNFLSAATGIVVAIALIRGIARHSVATIGNAWVDLTRATLYILLPISLLFALFLISQGAIQNFSAYKDVHTLEVTQYQNPRVDASGAPLKDAQGNVLTEAAQTATQTLPMGPIASQEAIKMLGTNGGGPFNANSAHPYENPTPLSNFVQMLSIFLIPAALCFAFGRMVGDQRQGWAIFISMAVLFVISAVVVMDVEQNGNPLLASLGIDQSTSALQPGGNMEGKETRFGIADSGLFVAVTTAASCGAVNSMHDSLMPLGGFVPLWNMMLGEVVFGGVGSGLYGMLIFALMAVFIAGLMIGRTPEYLGKKIESFDMKMIAIAILATPVFVLACTSIAVLSPDGRAGIANPGPHGFSEILYAFTSAANNNGSAFAGLSANTPFYNVLTAVAMWFGRFAVIVPVLGVA